MQIAPSVRAAVEAWARPPEFFARVVGEARRHGGRPDLEVALLVTDDAEIARLHGTYLGEATPTDVIAFALDDASADIAASAETAQRVASAHGHDPAAELALYVVHGILHVCGHDDHDDAARARMRVAERAVLDALSLEVTPVDR